MDYSEIYKELSKALICLEHSLYHLNGVDLDLERQIDMASDLITQIKWQKKKAKEKLIISQLSRIRETT